MDSGSSKKTRSFEKGFACERGRKDPRREVGESGAFEKPNDEKAGEPRRDFQENAKKIKNMYGPLVEQLLVLVEYIYIMEKKSSEDRQAEMSFIINFLNSLKKQCEIYLNYEYLKAGKSG